MRTLTKILLVPSLVAGGVLLPSSIRAQVDVEPPMPNVLILLDTSGSMSRKMGTVATMDEDDDGAVDFPDCGGDAAEIRQSRWFSVVQALTGDVEDGAIGCRALDRSSDDFEDLYGDEIYDRGYYIPYYQLQSNGCMVVPKKSTWNKKWHEFPDNAIVTEEADGDDCDFDQLSNGVIDAYKNQIRFGLMTFDPLVDPRTGMKDGESDKTDEEEGSKGTYSYWFRREGSLPNVWNPLEDEEGDWRTAGADPEADDWYATGMPPDCVEPQSMEVGARGPAAPPWEGRLMSFGEYRASAAEVNASNSNVEEVILAARPFGATPLAGMMSDAADFIVNDDTTFNPKGPDKDVPFGPRSDDLWDKGQGCRPFHVVLITDGEPNLDLLPDCDPDGVCPFPSIVDSPFYDGHSGDNSTVNLLHDEFNIVFHVVGVSLATLDDPGVASTSCADYSESGPPAARARCLDPTTATAQERTCCLLNSIASEGGDDGVTTATYAGNSDEVKEALDLVLSNLARGTASRTTPVYQSVSPTFYVENVEAAAVGHEILSSLSTTVGSGMWKGNLERIRFQCDDDGVVGRDAFEPENGDSFSQNLAENPESRVMFTAIAATPEDSWKSLRPHLASPSPDGLAFVAIDGVYGDAANTWAASVPTDAFDLTVSQCEADFDESNLDDCRTELLKWYTGQESEADVDRIPSALANPVYSPSPMGAIYHSQPVIVGPPREFVRDESYDIFAQRHAQRPTVAYAATIDGQLHAFLLADNTSPRPDGEHEPFSADVDEENNELWSFVPPIVLPYLGKNVNKHALLLDGGIAVKNVALERSAAAISGTDYTDLVQYRTALVASSGNASTLNKGGGYYFALDVTDPRPDRPEDFDDDVDFDADDPTTYTYDSPKFLWQLSRNDTADAVDDDDAGAGLFGDNLPAAAITSIAYLPPDSDDPPIEVAVAILAGGRTIDEDDDEDPDYTDMDDYADPNALWSGEAGADVPRTRVRDYGDGGRSDRSVTIVRIDTGEILYRFKGMEDDPDVVPNERQRAVGFMAPMSGTPVAFPGLPGQVSSRIYIGDAEGMLWEIDVSNPSPEDWTMKIAWDPYRNIDMEAVEDEEIAIGPVETVPVVSVTELGEPVVVFATGGQESFYQKEGVHFVQSLKGDLEDGGYDLNWEIDLANVESLGEAVFPASPMTNDWGVLGQRVTGPINIFDGVVYFSTFVPSDSACEVGVSRIWGVHYTDGDGSDPKDPVPAWDPDDDGTDEFFEQRDDAIVFGVSIGQQPSCRDTSETTVNDPVFGKYTTFTSTPPGNFELVVQTGRKGSPSTADGEATTKTEAWTLRTPDSSVRVDGWASIVE